VGCCAKAATAEPDPPAASNWSELCWPPLPARRCCAGAHGSWLRPPLRAPRLSQTAIVCPMPTSPWVARHPVKQASPDGLTPSVSSCSGRGPSRPALNPFPEGPAQDLGPQRHRQPVGRRSNTNSARPAGPPAQRETGRSDGQSFGQRCPLADCFDYVQPRVFSHSPGPERVRLAQLVVKATASRGAAVAKACQPAGVFPLIPARSGPANYGPVRASRRGGARQSVA